MTDLSLPVSSETPPGGYDRPAQYHDMIVERDVRVPMRDGVEICVDIYRPRTDEPLPALLAFAIYNKDLQGPDMAAAIPRSRPGRPCGAARRRPVTPASWYPAATSTSSACPAASANQPVAACAPGTPTT